MGTATDQFPQAAGNDKGDQDYRGELAGDEVDQPGDKAHQQDRAHFLHLGAHHQVWDAGEQGDKARHQDPQQRVQPAQEHKGKVDDKVDGGEDSHGDDIPAAHSAAAV